MSQAFWIPEFNVESVVLLNWNTWSNSKNQIFAKKLFAKFCKKRKKNSGIDIV